MDCLHPLLISNPNGVGFIESGGSKIFVPCGRCSACIVSSSQEWRIRLEIENECSETSYFVTLTYDEDKIPIGSFSDSLGVCHIVPYVSKRDVQLFLKRLRRSFEGYEIRYFLVSEYGPTTLRPHYHCLLFGLPRLSQDDTTQLVKVTKAIQKIWSNGFVTLDYVTYGRISYVTKYLSCVTDLPEYLPRPFRLMSRRPGLGAIYMSQSSLVDWHRRNLACYYPSGNSKLRLPRYLKDKLFDDSMKLDIRENIESFRKSKIKEDIELSKSLGYSNYIDYRADSIDRHIRKFNKKLKKSRKDV